MSQENIAGDFALNSAGQFPLTMSPKDTSGASRGTMAEVRFSPDTAAQWFATYHSRLPPASSSLSGFTQPVCVSYVNCGLCTSNGNAIYAASFESTASLRME